MFQFVFSFDFRRPFLFSLFWASSITYNRIRSQNHTDKKKITQSRCFLLCSFQKDNFRHFSCLSANDNH